MPWEGSLRLPSEIRLPWQPLCKGDLLAAICLLKHNEVWNSKDQWNGQRKRAEQMLSGGDGHWWAIPQCTLMVTFYCQIKTCLKLVVAKETILSVHSSKYTHAADSGLPAGRDWQVLMTSSHDKFSCKHALSRPTETNAIISCLRVLYACVFHESLPIAIIHEWAPLRVLPRLKKRACSFLSNMCGRKAWVFHITLRRQMDVVMEGRRR